MGNQAETVLKRILITGGAGFIGSNFVHYMAEEHPDYELIVLDLFTYAGNPENLNDVRSFPYCRVVHGDITDRVLVKGLIRRVDAVVNFAAESHVDRSLHDPDIFIRTNVGGTQTLLDAAKEAGVQRFVQISTDEVYGSLGPTGYFTEESPLMPNNPYAASKAGADLLARAYFQTFGLPVLITRCSNNYGPYQHPEKLIPLFITNVFEGRELPVYGDGENVRDWIYVEDHCRAIDAVLHRGKPGEVYNVGSQQEMSNLAITRTILQELGKPESLIRFVKDRPGHDRRYATDAAKLKEELGWKPMYLFTEGIQKTIRWYLNHEAWWRRIKAGQYQQYYQKLYRNR